MRWFALVVMAFVAGCGSDAELASLRARVESLERDNAEHSKQVASLRAAAAKPVVIPSDIACDKITAKTFVMEGPDGQILGSWYTGTLGPSLSIRSRDGKSQSMMTATDDTASIFAQRSNKRMLITSRQDGATMAIAEEGTTGHSTNGRAAIGIGPAGNAIIGLKNHDGEMILPIPTDEPRQ